MKKDFQKDMTDIESIRLKFQDWRSQRKLGTRVPEELWNLAIELTSKHSISGVARILGLDYFGLRNRVHGVHPVECKDKEKPQRSPIGSSPFIELKVDNHPPPSSARCDRSAPIASLGFVSADSQCLMELLRADGTTMRIYSTAVSSSSIDITRICESFLKT